ncbi:hypothetical protein Bca101_094055 [Brassica carinata]
MSSSTHLQFVTGSGSPLQIPPFQRPRRSQKSYLKGLGVSAENPSDTFLTLGSVAVSKVVHLLLQNMEMSKKIESIIVSEPNDYILNSPPQNRGEAALLRARPVVLEMTAEKPTVTEDGHAVKKARVE